MFTGIVETVGRVTGAGDGRLRIRAPQLADRLLVGGSVAVNGACLTVTATAGGEFAADVVPETLRRTNLGALASDSPVNLELPLRLDRGLDGHLVQGHVDAIAEVDLVEDAGSGREVGIRLPAELAPLVAEKGSIAVDGVSLTVASVAGSGTGARFTVALIPHTLERTIAAGYRPGTLVNLEADLVARYLRRILEAGGTGRARVGRVGLEDDG